MRNRNYFDLFKEFFITDFKLRYKHSTLGLLWVIVKPLALFSVLYVVWSSLFKTSSDFALYLLLGVMTINFFSEGINFGLQSLFNKAHIILKINFPREIVVLTSISIAVVNYLINLGIFLAFAEFNLPTNSHGLLLFLIALISLVLLILGISLFLSILSIKLHDIRHLVELVLQLAFWATPVIYNINVLPENIRNLVNLNPLTHILEFMRIGLLNPSSITNSSVNSALLLLFLTFVLFILGILFFKSRIRKIAQYF